MNKLTLVKKFIGELIKRFGFKFYLALFLGVLNSLLQGVSIVMIIPLLQTLENKSENPFFVKVLKQIGWDGSLEYLLTYYFAILVLYAVFRASFNYFSASLVSSFTRDFTFQSFREILKSDWEFNLKHERSKLTNLYLNEYQRLRNLTNQSFRILQYVCLVLIQLTFTFILSWKISSLTLACLGIIYIIQKKLVARNYNHGKDRVTFSQKLQQLLTETFSGVKLIKISKSERYKTNEFYSVQNNLYTNELKSAKLDSTIDFLFVASSAVVIITIIYVNFHFKIMHIGGLLMVLVLLSRVISQTQSLVLMSSVWMNHLPTYQHFLEVFEDAKNFQVENNDEEKQCVSVDVIQMYNVDFLYGSNSVLKEVNQRFEKGKLYLLFGPSGRGKTTTLDLLAGLIKPSFGKIYVNNDETIELQNNQVNIGYVLQETILFHGTIAENIAFDGNYTDDKIKEIIENVGLQKVIDRFPEGIHAMLDEGTNSLSGGEKQRIAIARALIQNTDILLLDEVTSSLDTHSETEIMNLIHELKHNKIIILVGHKERLKDWADEVVYY